jgi:hypothetical protein
MSPGFKTRGWRDDEIMWKPLVQEISICQLELLEPARPPNFDSNLFCQPGLQL